MCLANKIMPLLVTIQSDNVMRVHEIESEGLQKDLPYFYNLTCKLFPTCLPLQESESLKATLHYEIKL